jgi:hypothetical protein
MNYAANEDDAAPDHNMVRRFQYNRRTPEQRRRAAGLVEGRQRVDDRWLAGLLQLARKTALSRWEAQFVRDIAEKHERFGRVLILSDKQIGVLRRIEQKLGRA